jgi:hypothetical protein
VGVYLAFLTGIGLVLGLLAAWRVVLRRQADRQLQRELEHRVRRSPNKER